MTVEEYRDFADNCCNELELLQDNFKSRYNLNWYESWNYNQDIGIFSFNTGSAKIYFNYVQVGTFSNKSNTWKWSWDNRYTAARVKVAMRKVQAFGIDNDIAELKTGLLPTDEYLGWKFTAIAAKLLNAEAAYRVPSDSLLTYVLLLNAVTESEANILAENIVQCEQHYGGWASFICQHLSMQTKSGFNEAFESSPDMILEPGDSFQAWCNECETERLKEGEWNDSSEAFARIKLVCSGCYFDIKEHNLGYR